MLKLMPGVSAGNVWNVIRKVKRIVRFAIRKSKIMMKEIKFNQEYDDIKIVDLPLPEYIFFPVNRKGNKNGRLGD